ncbi:hypothetical protein ACF0H5_009154 [Mactra antiquata]
MAVSNCSLCGKTTKHLMRTCGTQSAEDKDIMNKLSYTFCTQLKPSNVAWICHTCFNTVEKFYKLKKFVLRASDQTTNSLIAVDQSEYDRKYSISVENSSPDGPTPKRRRVSTVEQNVKSFEKFNVCEDDCENKEESPEQTKRKLDFIKMDHAYCCD